MLSDTLMEDMKQDGLALHRQATPQEISRQAYGCLTLVLAGGRRHGTDCVVWATGRAPATDKLKLQAAGVAVNEHGFIPVDAYQNTNVPGIYAVGDVVHYPGKRKLILSGFHEATLAAFAAAEQLAGQKVPLEYTTSSERLQRRLGVTGTSL